MYKSPFTDYKMKLEETLNDSLDYYNIIISHLICNSPSLQEHFSGVKKSILGLKMNIYDSVSHKNLIDIIERYDPQKDIAFDCEIQNSSFYVFNIMKNKILSSVKTYSFPHKDLFS
jgi:hypothetical protein